MTAKVVEALTTLAAAGYAGDLVSIVALRKAAKLSKSAFDGAVLKLIEADKVVVHMHDLPASLPKAEREAMVTHPDGTVFCQITFRRAK